MKRHPERGASLLLRRVEKAKRVKKVNDHCYSSEVLNKKKMANARL
jgi:hypothetical protein